jgi:4-hydroxy-4-methyl-2-oxoglutarate aldolase
MQFPAWSKHVSPLGTVKERLGTVNEAIEIAGVRVEPGDIVVADDDGVVVVPHGLAQTVLDASGKREEKELQSRKRYAAGELSLDVSDMRGELERKGLRYE